MRITITNGKGGTGKTTLTTFLAEHLFTKGFNVLMIDLDPSCSLSEIFGRVLCDQNSRQLLSGQKVRPYNIKAKGFGRIDLIPSDLDLDQLANMMDTQLKIQLKKQGFSDDYDFILIDPPGTWNAQTRNAVFAADSVVVVGNCSPLDLAATEKYFAKHCECYLDADVTIVCNSYNKKADPDNIWQRYQDTFRNYLLKTPIPRLNSLKRMAHTPDYVIRADIAAKLDEFVAAATLGKLTAQGEAK